MEISEDDIKHTVLALFGERHMRAGDIMWMSRIELFWLETGLRRADLLNGIALLCSEGLLDIEELDGETDLSLSEAGEQRVAELWASAENGWKGYLRKELLPSVRKTDVAEREDGKGRRDYEAEAPPEIPWTR